MQLHQIKAKDNQKRKRVGRGGKRGTFSGRGVKGQKARAGTGTKPIIREVIKKYPKLRGYKTPQGKKVEVVNLRDLEKVFKSGDEISPTTLLEKGLVKREKGRVPEVKILGQGKIKKAFNIKGCLASKKAKELIEKAGGSLKE